MQDEFIREVAFQHIPVEYHDYIWQKLGAVSYCGGFDGAVCCFAARGGRAQLGAGGAAACVFCCPDSMAALCAEVGGPSQLARRLRQMTAAARGLALEERVPRDRREAVLAKLGAAPGATPACRKRPAADVDLLEVKRRWTAALAQRRAVIKV